MTSSLKRSCLGAAMLILLCWRSPVGAQQSSTRPSPDTREYGLSAGTQVRDHVVGSRGDTLLIARSILAGHTVNGLTGACARIPLRFAPMEVRRGAMLWRVRGLPLGLFGEQRSTTITDELVTQTSTPVRAYEMAATNGLIDSMAVVRLTIQDRTDDPNAAPRFLNLTVNRRIGVVAVADLAEPPDCNALLTRVIVDVPAPVRAAVPAAASAKASASVVFGATAWAGHFVPDERWTTGAALEINVRISFIEFESRVWWGHFVNAGLFYNTTANAMVRPPRDFGFVTEQVLANVPIGSGMAFIAGGGVAATSYTATTTTQSVTPGTQSSASETATRFLAVPTLKGGVRIDLGGSWLDFEIMGFPGSSILTAQSAVVPGHPTLLGLSWSCCR